LQALHQAGHEIVLVLTQPDRPAGRGMKLQPSAVKQFALEQGLALAQPRSLRLDGKYPQDAQEAQLALQQAAPDVLVVAAYGLILPQWVLNAPRWGCLNIHASLLPRWRGAAPIHRAIEAGDAQTGVCIMQMDEGLDTGAVVLQESLVITAEDTTSTLHDRLAHLGAQLIVQVLAAQNLDGLQAKAQSEQGVCYAHKIDKSEGVIDWSQDAVVIARRVRAFAPMPGTSTTWQGELLKVGAAHAQSSSDSVKPGTVVRSDGQGIVVQCGQGALVLTELQRAGARRMNARDFLRGHDLPVGTVLGA
jgi:methionyl-tRNA formyltransferase